MATANIPTDPAESPAALRDEWLALLTDLVATVETWARALDWSTKRIDKPMQHDPQFGPYRAPALVLQHEFAKVMLEPIARYAVGTDGTVDLYRMPDYDNVAHLFRSGGRWHLLYSPPGEPPIIAKDEFPSRDLTPESLAFVLDGLRRDAD